MSVFQCCGCPTGPCILTNMDPEFIAERYCPDERSAGFPATIAVWRELGVVE
jgi:hypothetical protein